ncbi:MAG: hypothetical protein AABP62_07395 [Planctomycetota bacterium]
MCIRNQRLLLVGCLLTSLMSAGFVAFAKDKEKDKPAREQPARAAAAPAAGRAASNANRGSNSPAKEAPRQRVESAPKIERRNESAPPASTRSMPQANPGNGPSKRDAAPRDNRGNNDRGPAKVIGGGQGADPRPSVNSRPDRGKIDATPGRQPEVRVDRRDRNPQGNGNPAIGSLNQRDNDKNKTDRRDDSKPKLDVGKPGGNPVPRVGGAGNPGGVLPTGPAFGGVDGNRTRDRRDNNDKNRDGLDKNSLPKLEIPKNEPGRPGPNPGGDATTVNPGGRLPSGPALGGNNALDRRGDNDRNRDARDKNSLPKLDVPRIETGRPNLNPGNDARTGVVRGNVNLPGSSNTAIIGRGDNPHRTTPIRIEKNGRAPKLEGRPEVVNLKPEVSERIANLRQTHDRREFERQLNELKSLPDARSHAHHAGLKLDRVSGVYQQRVEQHDFRHLHNSDVGRRLNLDRQFQLHRHGDLSRQMNLGPALVQAGGWQHRHHGRVVPTFTQSSVSVWYAGGGYYPRYCWTPRWTPWVDWCWWDTCLPIYDPRPVYCRPIVYTPSPTWVVYEYPVWQPLPMTTCGTWVDVPPVVVDSGTDLQLLATRFVDNGHPDQNLGPRYRVWLRNNGPLAATTPFNVVLVAANDPVPVPDLPQAGAVVNGIEAGEIQSVDIRLPLAANRLAVTPEGQRIPFGYLHVLVDSHRDLAESNESNNGSVVARNDILPVDPAAFSSDVSAGAPGTVISVAGEGLGPEPGQVIVSINGLQLQAEIHGWYDLGVRFALPNLALAGPTDADILIVRGDGAAANPLDFDLVPQTMLSESPLPPIPSP